MIDFELLRGSLILIVILAGFLAMIKLRADQALVMPLVALACLTLNLGRFEELLTGGLSSFARVAVLFTAVAVPAHMVERSGAFRQLGTRLGFLIGLLSLWRHKLFLPVLIACLLLSTYFTAALFHNITSILVMTPIIIQVCAVYSVPSRWVLSGALIASNLGGFSTSWGDTPNIIEAKIWQLNHLSFACEIMWLNLIVLAVLAVAVLLLTRRQLRLQETYLRAYNASLLRQELSEINIDRRLLGGGFMILSAFIMLQLLWPQYELVLAAVAIIAAVLWARPDEQLRTLQSLDLGLYMTLSAIFCLAGAVEGSTIGLYLRSFVETTNGAPWAIASASYVGTMLTEAASWAAAVAPIVHQINPTHSAAWALGGGICAGSSTLITAASAGIILATESRKYPGHEITFGKYLPFGIACSLFMLLIYALYFSCVA